jgi:hypothetical protein
MVWRFDFDFKVGSHFFFIVECFDFYFLCFSCGGGRKPGHSPFRQWLFSPWSVGCSVQGQKLEHTADLRNPGTGDRVFSSDFPVCCCLWKGNHCSEEHHSLDRSL